MPVKIIILYEFIMLLNNIDVHVYLQIELNHTNKREQDIQQRMCPSFTSSCYPCRYCIGCLFFGNDHHLPNPHNSPQRALYLIFICVYLISNDTWVQFSLKTQIIFNSDNTHSISSVTCTVCNTGKIYHGKANGIMRDVKTFVQGVPAYV